MEQKSEGVRDRLLARLPQPEDVAAYKEETASLLAKHKKALFWEKMGATVCFAGGAAIWLVANLLGKKLGLTTSQISWFWAGAGLIYFVGMFGDLRYRIYQSKVDTLKEIKQVQLQVLELQASLQKPEGK